MKYSLIAALSICLTAATAMAGEAPAASANNPDIDAARKFVRAALPGQCDEDDKSRNNVAIPVSTYQLTWRYSFETKDDSIHHTTLYEVFCDAGAYNYNYAYVLKDKDGVLSLASFAEPEFNVEYVKGDDSHTKLKRPPRANGFSAGHLLTNAEYDPEDQVLSEYAKWRGIGDAWSAGQWVFRDGKFVLTKFTIDPIYEGNVDNPSDALTDTNYQLYPAPSAK
jgi:hypothetical protein